MAARLILVLALGVGLAAPAEGARVPPAIKQAWKRTTRAVSRVSLGMSARSRLFLDRVEDRLAARGLRGTAALLQKTRMTLRPWSPLALGGFLQRAVKSRPQLVKGYLAVRIPLEVARVVALPFLPGGIGAAVFFATGVPFDAAYLVGAEYLAQRKAAPPGQKPGLVQTFRAVGKEYGAYRVARERKLAVALRAARAEGLAIAPATP